MKNALFYGVFLSAISSTFASPAPRPEPIPDLKPPTPNGKPDEGGQEHIVTVSQKIHTFYPLTLQAAVGDVIRFQFFPVEHSVTLGYFGGACLPWSWGHPGEPDVWSGLIKTEEVTGPPAEWTYKVVNTDPNFFYCSGKGSCKDWGMVFALNPNATQTYETYYQDAQTVAFQLSPGEIPPKEDGSLVGEEEEEKEAENKEEKHGLSTAAIAGIAIGSVIAIALIGILFFMIGRKKSAAGPEKTPLQAPAPGSEGYDSAQGGQFTEPPPGYDRAFSPAPSNVGSPQPQHGWDNKRAPVSPGLHPGFQNQHTSTYGAPGASDSGHPGHTSWAPSELAAEPVQAVEIYTQGVDEQTPGPAGR